MYIYIYIYTRNYATNLNKSIQEFRSLPSELCIFFIPGTLYAPENQEILETWISIFSYFYFEIWGPTVPTAETQKELRSL